MSEKADCAEFCILSIKLAFDGLRFEEVLYHDLHALDWRHVLQRLCDVLQDDVAGKIGIFGFKCKALMAETAADVDEECLVWLRGPSAELLFDRED